MVSGLTELEQSALKKFKRLSQKATGGNLLELKLFGSRARGDARKDSDIDVLVITATGDWRMSDAIYGVATEILLEDEICISPKVINKKDYDRLRKMKTPFIENVIREGITI